MKVLVTGATGMLGRAVMQVLRAQQMDCLGVSCADMDLTDETAIRSRVEAFRPDAIVHCAAYTAVDAAEQDVRRCMAVNSLGTMHLARAARRVGAKLMYISTDYVFDGRSDVPFEATDRPCPLNVYGLSKLQGEEAVRGVMTRYFILRTSWLFGAGGRNFVRTMLRLSRERSFVRVVDDQLGAPTYTADLARLIAKMIVTDRYGIYHATNEGECSFAEYAAVIMAASGSKCRVEPVSSAAYGAPAKRPQSSRLSKASLDAAGFPRLPPWEDALARYLALAGEEPAP